MARSRVQVTGVSYGQESSESVTHSVMRVLLREIETSTVGFGWETTPSPEAQSKPNDRPANAVEDR